MKPEERQSEIMTILRTLQRELRIEELSEILGKSPLTIRRDLKELAQKKQIIRTHGGCLATGRLSLDSYYYRNVAENFSLKQAIGKTAASLVEPDQTILLGDGSTTFHMSFNLDSASHLTIYTNSVALITELGRFEKFKLSILGGEYNENLYSLTGTMTEQILELLRFDQVFLGVNAIDECGRCLVDSQEDAGLLRAMLSSGGKKILLADRTKVGAKSYIVFADLKEFDLWITNPGIDQSLLTEFKTQIDILETNP